MGTHRDSGCGGDNGLRPQSTPGDEAEGRGVGIVRVASSARLLLLAPLGSAVLEPHLQETDRTGVAQVLPITGHHRQRHHHDVLHR